jgi:hypothetical protein
MEHNISENEAVLTTYKDRCDQIFKLLARIRLEGLWKTKENLLRVTRISHKDPVNRSQIHNHKRGLQRI